MFFRWNLNCEKHARTHKNKQHSQELNAFNCSRYVRLHCNAARSKEFAEKNEQAQ